MIARIAAGLALNPRPENRWRQVVVPVCAGIFILLLLASTSVLFTLQRELERVGGRLPVKAAEPAPTDLLVASLDDVWRGEQFPVWWIKPATDAKPVLPPGMQRLPEPGQAVVSPELDRLASNHPSLAQRYPDRLVLQPKGLRSGEELIAYVRLPKDRAFPDSKTVIRASHFDPGGDEGFFEVFARSSAPLYAYLEGFGALLIIPGLVVLVVGAAAGSSVRGRRFEVLAWLGARRRTVAALGALETVILALPGVALVSIAWGFIAPRLGAVPLVRHDVVRGDLALPAWVLAAEAGVALMTAGLTGLVATTLRRRKGPRPALGRVSLSPLRWVPLTLGLVLLALTVFGVGPAANLALLGALAVFGGMPLALPGILRLVGRRLGRLEPVPAFLAGRELSWNPLRAPRPLLGIATVMVVALAGVGAIAKGTPVEGRGRPALSGAISTASVTWLDPHPGDIRRLSNALDTGLVVPMRPPSHGHGGSHGKGQFAQDSHSHGNDHSHDKSQSHEHDPGGGHGHGQSGHSHGNRGAGGHAHGEAGHSHENEANGGHSQGQANALTLGVACSELARYFSGAKCGTVARFELPPSLERKIAQATLLGGPEVNIQLAPPRAFGDGGRVLALSNKPQQVYEERVRTAAMSTLPAPYVTSALASVTQRSPLIPWIIGGIIAAVLALTAGCLLSLVNHFKEGHKYSRQLLAIGVTPRRYVWLEACRFGTTYLSAVAASFAIGVVMCLLIVGIDTPVPWTDIGITLAAALLAGLAGMTAMISFGVRRIYRVAD